MFRISAASCTSSSVARNAAISPGGRSRTNPTVSEHRTRRREGKRMARMVGSRAAARGALAANSLDSLLDFANALANLPAVGLQLLLAGSARSDAAAEPGE